MDCGSGVGLLRISFFGGYKFNSEIIFLPNWELVAVLLSCPFYLQRMAIWGIWGYKEISIGTLKIAVHCASNGQDRRRDKFSPTK